MRPYMQTYPKAMQSHSHCMVCSDPKFNPHSLNLRFQLDAEGWTNSQFSVTAQHQSYHGLLHGGMTSTLLDAAMTHCLLMRGIKALTAELSVRFIAPIRVGTTVTVQAKLLSQKRGFYRLEAFICQGSQQLARASAKFIQASDALLTND